ncbi:MAG: hypothetical protein ACP5G0_07595 [Desulfomonilia bacterium]
MSTQKNDVTACSICGEAHVTATCDTCGRPLCKKCRTMEIRKSAGEEIIIRSFCPLCRLVTEANPENEGWKAFGLEEITDMVNHGTEKVNRFRIKLKIS